MLMSLLMYGLILAVVIMPSWEHRKAAGSMLLGVLSVDIAWQFDLVAGHVYYLFAIAMTIAVVISLTAFSCSKLVNGLHNACAVMIVINSADWVLFAYSAIVSDFVYETVFVVVYLYVWYVMLGKGGADVVGRFKQLRDGSGHIVNSGSAKQCRSNNNKV